MMDALTDLGAATDPGPVPRRDDRDRRRARTARVRSTLITLHLVAVGVAAALLWAVPRLDVPVGWMP